MIIIVLTTVIAVALARPQLLPGATHLFAQPLRPGFGFGIILHFAFIIINHLSVSLKTDGLFIKRVTLQPIWQVAAHRELERVTLPLAECLPVEWPSRAPPTEGRLSPVAPVPHSKISSLAKQRPRALALDSAPENNHDRLLLF